MHITRVYIDGFKCLRNFDLEMSPATNIIVGDNGTGKTSVLEAINLALSCQFDGRHIKFAMDPYFFNSNAVEEYIAAVHSGSPSPPPKILIEVYFNDDPMLAKLKGRNNERCDDCPGLGLSLELGNGCTEALREYVKDDSNPKLIPVEYYEPIWLSFAGNPITWRDVPFKAKMIDTSLARRYRGPNRYVAQVVNDVLAPEQRNQLSLAYKRLRHAFTQEEGVAAINQHLATQGNTATKKRLTVQMDVSSRATWDSAITAHLDDLPFDCVGKGEQCRVQMRLAIASAAKSHVLLVEEPENHLSHSNMNMLMEEIGAQIDNQQQTIVTTHSAFVLNKLGIDNLRLLSPNGVMTLANLTPDTKDYFMKLPGYNTLRLLLSKRSILVEGPSDELIVQRAYRDKHGKLPLEDGTDVISVDSLAFKRFLEIAQLLKLDVCVVTDNDGKVEAVKKKYEDYINKDDKNVRIVYDDDETCSTLEPQLLRANSLKALNGIFGTKHESEEDMLKYMGNNKTKCALRMFETKDTWKAPGYIADAIE